MDEKKVREALESLKEEVQALKDLMREDEERRFFLINVYGEHEHLNIAIEALEKQLSKKVDEDECAEKAHYKCPICGRIPLTVYADGYRLGTMPKYCGVCGQKLDWSE